MAFALPVLSRAARPGVPPLLQALAEAMATTLASVASLLCTRVIAPGVGPAVLAVVLSISLSRSQLDRDLRGRLEAAIVLPLVAFAALGVGSLLRQVPWLGAAAFVAGMFVSIWLRRFGPMGRRAGGLIALPFVTLLTVPHVRVEQGGPLPAACVPIVIALLALFWVSLCHLLTRRLPWRALPHAAEPTVSAATAPLRDGLPASTRMAVQMAVALAASFVVGYVCFAERWAWIVLTAFVVNSGNRGRLDVVYKSGLRVLGAAAGTLLAMLFSLGAGLDAQSSGALILVALFLGIWLRPFNYAWWALSVTVALALLQGFDGGQPIALLWRRLEEIGVGAVIGIAAAWFVLPVRSTGVLRLRIAAALAALAEAFDPATLVRSLAGFDSALDDVERLAPPFRAARLLTARVRTMQPADWVDTLHACRVPAAALVELGAVPGHVRQALGAARKALKQPEALLPALRALERALHAG